MKEEAALAEEVGRIQLQWEVGRALAHLYRRQGPEQQCALHAAAAARLAGAEGQPTAEALVARPLSHWRWFVTIVIRLLAAVWGLGACAGSRLGERGGKRTKVQPTSEIVRVRLKSGLSQAQFAAALGVSKRTLEQWEQGRREPSGAAKQLLKIAERHPEVLIEVAV